MLGSQEIYGVSLDRTESDLRKNRIDSLWEWKKRWL